MSVFALPEMSLQSLVVGSLVAAFLLIFGESPTILLLAIVEIFVLVVAFIVRRRSKSRGSLVLLLGSADAGKTSILSTVSVLQRFLSYLFEPCAPSTDDLRPASINSYLFIRELVGHNIPGL